MTGEVSQSPIGLEVDQYALLGREHDGQGRWVGADLLLRVQPIGNFMLNVVTKGHYVDESMRASLREVEQPEALLGDHEPTEQKPPFVLNDEEITEEVLTRKFVGRRVEEDLAASLWPIET